MSSLTVGLVSAIFGCVLICLTGVESRVLIEKDVKAIIPENYTKSSPQNQTTMETVTANVILRTDAIRKLDVQTMEMTVDFRLELSWKDERLNVIEPSLETHLIHDEHLRDSFFIPKIDFVNHLQCNSKPGALQPSYGSWMTYFPYGRNLELLHEKSCIFECKFDLSDYPFDVQKCSIEIIHNVYFKEKLLLKGFTQGVSYKSATTIPPEWELSETLVENCTHSLQYPCIRFVYTLKRMLGHHIMTVFVPSVLVVILSWISFTLDVEQGPARVTLGLTTLLTLATQFLSAQKGLPPVAYVKAIDVWMIGCMIAVFLSMIEFAVANYVHRRCKMRKVEEKLIIRVGSGLETKKNVVTEDRSTSKMLDRIGGIAIASLFCCFVVIFWACVG